MDSSYWDQIRTYLSMCLSRNRDLSNQANFSSLQLSSFVEPGASVFNRWLTGVEPDVVFYCCRPSASSLDPFLLTTVVKSGHLSYCCLCVSSNQSDHSPRTSLIHKLFPSAELLLDDFSFLFFLHHFASILDCFPWTSRSLSSFNNYQISSPGTNNHATAKSLFHVTIDWSSWPASEWLYATWQADWLIARISRCIGVPNKELSVCKTWMTL